MRKLALNNFLHKWFLLLLKMNFEHILFSLHTAFWLHIVEIREIYVPFCHASSIEASECYAQFMLKYLQIPTPHFVQENLLQMNSFSSSDFKVQEIVSESVRQFAIGTCWSLRHWIYDGVAAWGHFPCTRPLWTCHLWKLALGLCDVQLGSDFNM